MIKLKRIYEQVELTDGYRVLVDRLWPRGVSKAKAALDLWLKEIAPTTELRQWFAHDPQKWSEFQKRYTVEVKANEQAFSTLRNLAATHQNMTILYAAKDEAHNEAVILKDLLS